MKHDESPHAREMDRRALRSVGKDAARVALALLLIALLGYFLFV